jgi:hypothetical protein
VEAASVSGELNRFIFFSFLCGFFNLNSQRNCLGCSVPARWKFPKLPYIYNRQMQGVDVEPYSTSGALYSTAGAVYSTYSVVDDVIFT